MPIKNTFMKVGIVVAFAALAACASNEPEPTAAPTRSVEPVVTPDPEPMETVDAIVPGSMQDLEENVGHRVYFGYDQYSLTPEAQDTLRRQAAWLKEYPEARIRIAGNCDERGTREYNLALGARRADAARAFLTSLGIDGSRITTISYGKERPIDPRSTPAAWSKNRNSTTTLVSTGS